VRKARAGLSSSLLWVADVLASAWVYTWAAHFPALRSAAAVDPSRPEALLVPALAACLAGPLWLELGRRHAEPPRDDLATSFGRLLFAAVCSTLLVALALAAVDAPLRPAFPLVVGAAQLCVWTALHALFQLGRRGARHLPRGVRNALVVGSGSRALHVLRQLQRHPEWGLRVVGFLDERDTPHDPRIRVGNIYRLGDLPNILRSQVIDEVIAACPRSMLERIGPVVATCASAGIPLTLLSDLYGDYLPPPRVTRFGGLAALSFSAVHHSRPQLAAKRVLDVLGAGLALLVLAPAAAFAATFARGALFTSEIRCGRQGRPFRMWSLRATPRQQAWHLDALPRLWNVLRGDMSFVGPRPPTPREVAAYETFDRRRLSMRPGLTCLVQVSPGDLAARPRDPVKLDLEYIDAWSLWLDLRILLRAVTARVRGLRLSLQPDHSPGRAGREQALPRARGRRLQDVHRPADPIL